MQLLRTYSLVLAAVVASASLAHGQAPRRVIDVHLHAFPANWPASRPPFNHATGRPSIAASGAQFEQTMATELDRFNVHLAILSGPLDIVRAWRARSPRRFIVGPQFPMAYLHSESGLVLEQYWPSMADLQAGNIGVIGEITAQYAGLAPEDSQLDSYFALAEQLDLPVGIHTGTGPPAAGLTYPDHLLSVGDPLLLEPVLRRYPRLRLYLMHAGYPYLASTIAIFHKYPQVHADLSAINWRMPTAAFHDYLRTLVVSGFGDRLMFGSDAEAWPEAIGLAVASIESAAFLTAAQKDDIFYNNAARFFRVPTR